jgi:hypothetical protein
MKLVDSVFLPDGSCLSVSTGNNREVFAILRNSDGTYPPDWTSLHTGLLPSSQQPKWRASSMPVLTHDGNGLVLIDVNGVDPANIADSYVPWRMEYRHPMQVSIEWKSRFSKWKVFGPAFTRVAFVAPSLL